MRGLPAALFLSAIAVAQTADRGTVSGRVLNSVTGAYLEGAEVSVVGQPNKALTDREGYFQITNVPAGSQTVNVFYTGLDAGSATLSVTAGQSSTADIRLNERVLQLGAFTVSNSREGEAASITKQRNADNIKNVVSMDTFGSVADGNVGNFMVRLPGVSGEFENGEVVGIKIRGTPVEFSALNVDGVRATGAFSGFNTQGDRGAQSDQIPAEFIKEVEVIKSLTPDQPADSIGGATNLITKSALDFQEDVLTYRVGANRNLHRDDRKLNTPNAAASWLTRLGPKRDLGMALSLSYTDTEAPRDRAQMQRLEADGRNTQARTLTNINQRVRGGVGLKFDYNFSDRFTVSTKFQHNYYYFDSDRLVYAAGVTGARRVADYSVVSRAAIEAGSQPRDSANVQAGVAPGYNDSYTELINATWSIDADNNVKTGRQYLYDARGKLKIDPTQDLTIQGSYAPSNFKSNLRTFVSAFTPGIGMGIDTRANRSLPTFRQTYGPSILFGQTDFTRYTTQLQQQPETGEEEVYNGALDYLKRFDSWKVPVEIKSGVTWREQHRNTTVGRPNWNLTGLDGTVGTADDGLASIIKPTRAYTVYNNSGVWPDLPAIDYQRAWKLFNQNPELFRPIGTSVTAKPAFNEITEDVYAAYVQGKAKLGKFTVLGGVRFEKTTDDASGDYTDPRNTAITRGMRSDHYDDWFPSLHLTYDITKDLKARASASTGMARPNMSDLYPVTTVAYNATTGVNTVTQNDVGLKPEYAKNYDIALEYYFEPAGLLSAGVFRKDIKDFIARSLTQVPNGTDNGFGGNYAGYDLNTTTNQGKAKVNGFEINYSQQLTFLPKPFDGIRVFANYTRMTTKGTYSSGATDLVAFVPKTVNAGFSYLYRKFEFRTAYNYTSGFLTGFNAIEVQQNRRRPVDTTDFSAQYKFSPKIAVFLDVINAFNHWPETYTGRDEGRVTIHDVYGVRINAGLTGRF